MTLVGILHVAASTVSPALVMAAGLAVAGTTIVVTNGAGRRADRRARVGLGVFLVLAGGWLLAAGLSGRAPLDLWWLGALAVAAVLVRELVVGPPVAAPLPAPAGGRSAVTWAVVAWAATAALLLPGVGRHPGAMMAWEPSVIAGFGEALGRGAGGLRFLGERLLWDDGIVSRGDTSLLYGTGTFALFRTVGVSMWTVRIVAAVAALLCPPALFLATRRRVGIPVAAAAAALLALSPVLLFYGRYGTSLTGTLLGCLVAMGAVLWLIEKGWRRWWGGALCGLALFVATLGYSPARLVVIALATQAVVTLAFRGRGLGRRGAVSLALLLTVLGGAWSAQVRAGTAETFLRARGESILNFTDQPGYLQEYLGRPVAPGDLAPAERVVLIRRVLARTLPELGRVAGYVLGPARGRHELLNADPPRLPLVHAAFLPFVLVGFLVWSRRLRDPVHLAALLWFVALVGPVLLTTRVDIHRLMLLVVPLVLWGGAGVIEAGRALSGAGAPRAGRRLAAGALLLGAVLWNAAGLCDAGAPPRPFAQAVGSELARIEGPVAVGVSGELRRAACLDVALLERTRVQPEAGGRMLSEETVAALLDPTDDSPRFTRAIEERSADAGTLLLIPAKPFRRAAHAFEERGWSVLELGPPDAEFWRVDAGPLLHGPDEGRQAPSTAPRPGSQPPKAGRG